MKWLVFSDSHGNIDFMRKAVEREKPDKVLHLGDVVRDGERLREACPGLVLEGVRGNCDGFGGDAPEEKVLHFGTKRVWLLHGHSYHVKLGVGMLTAAARSKEVDVVLFGHTHQPLCYLDGDLWVMNPGTASGRPQATCGVIETREGQFYCRTIML